MKKLLLIMLSAIVAFFSFSQFAISYDMYNYGISMSSSPEDMPQLKMYKELTIDASDFTKSDIEYLHNNGVEKVYSYLNVGSIESFRNYYNEFEQYTLGEYANWEDERWIDVSNKKWQTYVVDTIAKELNDKNIDGFFIDNIDVYTLYKSEATYKGLFNILSLLKNKYDKEIIINNGYDFVNTTIEKGIDIISIIDGVNQEEVMTVIKDYDKNRFRRQKNSEVKFTTNYLSDLKAGGLNIYVIEYTKNSKLKNKIISKYEKLGYNVFISRKVNL